jgi:hypothetical protein
MCFGIAPGGSEAHFDHVKYMYMRLMTVSYTCNSSMPDYMCDLNVSENNIGNLLDGKYPQTYHTVFGMLKYQ